MSQHRRSVVICHNLRDNEYCEENEDFIFYRCNEISATIDTVITRGGSTQRKIDDSCKPLIAALFTVSLDITNNWCVFHMPISFVVYTLVSLNLCYFSVEKQLCSSHVWQRRRQSNLCLLIDTYFIADFGVRCVVTNTYYEL